MSTGTSNEPGFLADPETFLAKHTDDLERIATEAEAEGDEMKAALCRGALKMVEGDDGAN